VLDLAGLWCRSCRQAVAEHGCLAVVGSTALFAVLSLCCGRDQLRRRHQLNDYLPVLIGAGFRRATSTSPLASRPSAGFPPLVLASPRSARLPCWC
jgi:hypothetical protein